MDWECREQFEDTLLPGESLLWCGRPSRSVLFSKRDAFLIPFSLLWGGFALFWNVGVWLGGAPLLFRLFGLPFLAMGLYMIFGRFLHARSQKKTTFYALTDHRVLIRTKRGLSAQYLQDIPGETLAANRGGNGSITFGPASGQRFDFSPVPAGFVFADIDDCREVYDQYQALKHRAKQESARPLP